MVTLIRTLVLGLLIAASALPAFAQPGSGRPLPLVSQPSRGFISVNGLYQGTTTEFDDNFSFPRDQETGTTRVTYPLDAGAIFDVGGGVHLWRGLGAGVAVSRFTRDSVVRATSSVPHPLYLSQHREVAGDAGDVWREETGLHVQAQYALPIGRRLHVTLMGGPSIVQVSQSMVLDVNYHEEYPYDTATFTGVDMNRKKGTKTGYNVGADVRWMFTRSVGAGVLLRFTQATVDLETDPDRAVSVDAGGAQVGAGIRVRF